MLYGNPTPELYSMREPQKHKRFPNFPWRNCLQGRVIITSCHKKYQGQVIITACDTEHQGHGTCVAIDIKKLQERACSAQTCWNFSTALRKTPTSPSKRDIDKPVMADSFCGEEGRNITVSVQSLTTKRADPNRVDPIFYVSIIAASRILDGMRNDGRCSAMCVNLCLHKALASVWHNADGF